MKPAFKNVRWILIAVLLGIILADFFAVVSFWLYLIPVLLFFLLIVFGAFQLRWNFFVKAFTKGVSTENQFAITFDDGPAPQSLDVLDTLKKHGAAATFFCVGSRIEKHPDICARMAREGHTIGNHSFSHQIIFPFFSRKRIQNEIQQTNALIEEITGNSNRLFRPPFGVMNPAIAAAVGSADILVIGWNLRSFDTISKNPEALAKRIAKKIKPGTVLLLHDNLPETAAILDTILQHTAQRNLQTVDVRTIFGINQEI